MKNKSVAKPTAEFPYKKSGQKVGKMRADLEEFQAKQGVQRVDRIRIEGVHRRFTESSPDFRAFSLETLRQRFGAASVVWEGIYSKKCQQCDGKMSVIFTFFPRIAQYMRKSPIQFDILSSCLYVVVLKDL